MPTKHLLLMILATVGLLTACEARIEVEPSATEYADRIDTAKIRAHIEFLADDTLRGRDTGSDGYQVAANYVATQFKLLGIAPGNGGSYFQQVPFRSSVTTGMSAKLTIDGEQMTLEPGKDFVFAASDNAAQEAASGELVFVGYGVHAPEFDYSDYDGIDVRGKIVVMISRAAPEHFPSDERAYFSSGSYKYQEAVARGAVGVLTVLNDAWRERFTFEQVAGYYKRPGMEWVAPDGSVPASHPEIKLSGTLSYELWDKLLAHAPLPMSEIREKLKAGEPQSFVLPASFEGSRSSEWTEITAPNVIGVLEGSDPSLKNEYVLYSGHLDHTGERPMREGDDESTDRINNGAYDNATGIGIMLDVARVFSEMETRPKRSIIFLAVTAEEKGLLGSAYWANNPTQPIADVVANVNLDMPVLTFPLADVIAYGAEHSEMGDIVREQSAKQGLELSPDPWPEEVIFVRSDQYNFVKQGVPAVFLVPGWTSTDPAIDGEAEMRGFEEAHYHKPSDDLSLPFNHDSARRFSAANFLIGLEIANRKDRVKWKEGDFFGEKFAQ